MKRVKNIIALIIIVILMGGLLVVTYFFNKNQIIANEAIDTSKAHLQIFPEASQFMDADYNKDLFTSFISNEGFADDVVSIYSVKYAKDADGRVTGLLIDLHEYKRNGGAVNTCIGVSIEGTIKEIIILGITDQKGLDVQIDTPKFLSQFYNKFVDQFNLVTANVINDNDVLEVSGAHDASLAMVNGVNAALCTYTFLDGTEGGFANY